MVVPSIEFVAFASTSQGGEASAPTASSKCFVLFCSAAIVLFPGSSTAFPWLQVSPPFPAQNVLALQ